MSYRRVARRGLHGNTLGRVVDVQNDKRERHTLTRHIDLPSQRRSDRKILPVEQDCLLMRFEMSMMNPRSLVSVVDDDESVRESLPDLLKEFGFASRTFSSAQEFLASDALPATRCLLLDVTMPGMSGPELQQELKLRKITIPIIFITAQRGETLRPHLIEQGAIACLIKPFSDAAMLEALNSALQVK